MADDVITKGLLEEAFRAANGGKDIEVLDFTVSKAASFGDGFTTTMYGVKAEVKEGSDHKVITAVVKSMPSNSLMKAMVQEGKLFKKELGFYNTIIPDLIEFQRERNVKPLIPSVPKFYTGRDGADDSAGFLVLEDLRSLNFKMASVKEGLDLDHCLLVFKELAKLHAISFAYRKENGAIFHERFGNYLYDVLISTTFIEKFNMEPVMLQSIQTAVGIVRSSGNKSLETVADEFEKKVENPLATIKECLSQPTDPYGVICHGDAWCNNMMFRYGEDGRPLEVKLIDLQVGRYALPTTDLAYFLYMSTKQETRKKHFDNLLKSYHSTFLEVLAHLGTDAPGFTLAVLKDMFQRTALFGIISAINGLPSTLAERTVHQEMEKKESFGEILAVSSDLAVGNDLLSERLSGVIEDAMSIIF